MTERGPISVSSAEFVRRFGSWQDRAAIDPVVVTHHGRPRLVLLSASRYQQLVETGAALLDDVGDATELRLATLVDQLDAGFVAFDPQLRITAINALAGTYLRMRRDAAIGREPGEEMPDLGRSIARTHLARTLASGEASLFDAPSLAYPGQWLRLQTFPFGDGVGLLFRNVTGERSLRRLDEARTSFEAALGVHGAIGTGTLSQRATFIGADAGLTAMTGRTPDALEHVRLADLLPPARRAAAGAEIEAVLTGGGARAFESALLGDGDGELPVRIALAALRGDYAIDGATVVVTRHG